MKSNHLRQRIANERENFSQTIERFYLSANWVESGPGPLSSELNDQINQMRHELDSISVIVTNQTQLLSEFQGMRGRGRVSNELAIQINTAEQHLEQVNSVSANAHSLLQSANRLVELYAQQPSHFFIERFQIKQTAFRELVSNFYSNAEWAPRHLANDQNQQYVEPVVLADNQPIDDLYDSVFHTPLIDNLAYARSFETFQKEFIVNHCSVCEEISLTQLTNGMCSRCSRYSNLAPENLIDIEVN